MKFLRVSIWVQVVALNVFFSGVAQAEDGTAPVETKFTTGPVFFADADTHYSVGGAADFRLSRRLSFGTEFLYMYSFDARPRTTGSQY